MMSMANLVSRYGSPLYVYDLDRIDAALAKLRGALPIPNALYYSLKANPHPCLVGRLLANGCRAEVSSPGELASAVDAGASGHDCLYTGPGKTTDEIAVALQAGVRRFSVESSSDFARVAEVARACGLDAECLVRINVTEPTGGGAFRMTGVASQFGVDEECLWAHSADFSDRPGGRLVGAHFFPLSNARTESSLVESMTASLRSAARLRDELGMPMSVVDLGGGFAAPYAVPGELPGYPRLPGQLSESLDRLMPGWRNGEVSVSFESGRYLVGTAGRLVCTVVDVKRSREKRFVVLDSGINHLGGMTGLGRMMLAKPTGMEPGSTGKAGRATLVGPLCTPADLLAVASDAGRSRAGQTIEIPNVGAYGLTASLIGFLSRAAPVEVVMQGDEVVYADRLEVRRQMLASECTSPESTVHGSDRASHVGPT